MSNVLKTLEALYPDIDIKKLNDDIALTSLLSERELTALMSGVIDIKTLMKYKCYFRLWITLGVEET